MQRLEATFGTPLGFDPPDRERRGEALKMLRTEIGEIEQTAHQPAGRLADDHVARSRDRLEPCGEVGRLADHRLLLRCTLADQIADHDEPGRDADPGGECLAGRCRQPADRLNKRQPRAHGPLPLVLMRPRIAEIGQHAVAHELGDEALEACYHPGAGVLIRAQHLAHVLRIDPRRERGRSDQIDEHHRQLPPLGFGARSGLWGLRRWRDLGCRCHRERWLRQSRDRLEQLHSRPERDTELLHPGCRARAVGGGNNASTKVFDGASDGGDTYTLSPEPQGTVLVWVDGLL